MLANMIEIDPPAVDWSEQSVNELPIGTVTLLLADVEGSTRLWETQSDTTTSALEHLNRTVDDLVAAHGGVRPVEQGEGDYAKLGVSSRVQLLREADRHA